MPDKRHIIEDRWINDVQSNKRPARRQVTDERPKPKPLVPPLKSEHTFDGRDDGTTDPG